MSEAVCLRKPDGVLVDLATGEGEPVRPEEPEGRFVIRHSTAHVLAQAVLDLFPGARYAIGPPIDDPPGFYYDFDIGRPFTPEDLESIEAKMREIVAQDQPFVREEVSLENAAELFKGQDYKLEIINGIGEESAAQGVVGDKVSVYRNDGFVDLCRGPHLPSTGRIPAFKLMTTSGAYWRGDEKKPMLQRIYGTAWESQEALDDYLVRLEEAKRRDHRKLGRELELFHDHQLIGSGLPLWLPKGAIVRRELERFIVDEELAAGFEHVYSPHLAKKELYERSGHWQHYQDTMFPPMVTDHEELVLRPMNCPHHILIYQSRTRSYRELPVRIAELGTMYRYELSGVVTGLSRVRAMTLNDAHIFCRPDQIKEEFAAVMKMVERVYALLGITEYSYRLSLRDPEDKEKYVDNDEMWELGEQTLREALIELGLDFHEAKGEAAFYGPKLDIQLHDVLGREETYSTIQIDFHLPEQFGLEYVDHDGEQKRPVMIHRGVVSTMERMVAYLIELYAGAFPTWMAPLQAQVMPIAERHNEYASQVADRLRASGVRVEVAGPEETLGNRIRKAQGLKVPYMLIVGDREAEANTVSVRLRSGDELKGVAVDEAAGAIREEIATRSSVPLVGTSS